MRKQILFAALLVCTAPAIAQVRFSATNGEAIEMKKRNTTAAKQKATLVYFSSDKVPSTFEEVGILTVKDKDRAVAIDKAKIYGARATGDAVLLVDAKDQTAAQAVGKFFIGGSAFKGQYVFLVYRRKASTDVDTPNNTK